MSRVLHWEGCCNVRDLGGPPLAAGVPAGEVAADHALPAALLAREPRSGPPPSPRPVVHAADAARGDGVDARPPPADYGGVAGYLRSCGLDERAIERLRARLRP